jgi:peptidoglycan/LPS O-acetylase OafA/YrhL
MNHVSGFAYYNLYTFTRIDGICIGCMVALMQRINPGFLKKYTALIILSFAALNFAFFFMNRYYEFSFPYLALAGYTTFAMILGLLVNQAVTRENKWINLFMNIPFLKFFGRISYGFYLFHWPIYLLMVPYLTPWFNEFTNGWITQFSVSLIATLTAIILSWLSFNFFERYFLKLKHKFV